MKSFGKKIIVKFVRLLLLSSKSINPIQKCPHVTESYACILKTFVSIVNLSVDLLKNVLISFETCSIVKLSEYVIVLALAYNAIQ